MIRHGAPHPRAGRNELVLPDGLLRTGHCFHVGPLQGDDADLETCEVRPLSHACVGKPVTMNSVKVKSKEDTHDAEDLQDEEADGEADVAEAIDASENNNLRVGEAGDEEDGGEQARDARDVVPDPAPAIERLRKKHAAQRQLLRDFGTEADTQLMQENLDILCADKHEELAKLAMQHMQHARVQLAGTDATKRAALRELLQEDGRGAIVPSNLYELEGAPTLCTLNGLSTVRWARGWVASNTHQETHACSRSQILWDARGLSHGRVL